MITNKLIQFIFVFFFVFVCGSCDSSQNRISGKWKAKKVFVSRISTFTEMEANVLYQESFDIKGGKIYYKYGKGVADCSFKKVKAVYTLSKILDYNSLQAAKKELKNLSDDTIFTTYSFNCGDEFFGNFIKFSEDYEFATAGRDGATILFKKE